MFSALSVACHMVPFVIKLCEDRWHNRHMDQQTDAQQTLIQTDVRRHAGAPFFPLRYDTYLNGTSHWHTFAVTFIVRHTACSHSHSLQHVIHTPRLRTKTKNPPLLIKSNESMSIQMSVFLAHVSCLPPVRTCTCCSSWSQNCWGRREGSGRTSCSLNPSGLWSPGRERESQSNWHHISVIQWFIL